MRACNKNLTGFFSLFSLVFLLYCQLSNIMSLSAELKTGVRKRAVLLTHGGTYCFASRQRKIFNFFLLSCR